MPKTETPTETTQTHTFRGKPGSATKLGSRDRASDYLSRNGFRCEESGRTSSDWVHPDGRFATLSTGHDRTTVRVVTPGEPKPTAGNVHRTIERRDWGAAVRHATRAAVPGSSRDDLEAAGLTDEFLDERFEEGDSPKDLADLFAEEVANVTFEREANEGGYRYVNAYVVSRHYGGPEEGGWHYDRRDAVASVKTREGRVDAMREFLKGELPSCAEVLVETRPARPGDLEPAPRYE